MNKYKSLIVLLIIFLCSCSGMQANPVNQETVAAPIEEPLGVEPGQTMALESQAILTEFYYALNLDLYERAVALYGGSYEVLEYFNPTIEPDNKAALLRAACELNGFMCLPILDSSLVETHNEQDFVYEVTFTNPDGSLFVLGPCCGATEETMPPVSEFNIHVSCENESSCQVLDILPWAP